MPATRTRLSVHRLEPRDVPAVFTVTSPAASGDGSLFAALTAANASPGPDRVEFALPGAAVQTIALSRQFPLPALGGDVVVDGYTQPGSGPNTLAVGSDARILVEVDGGGTGVGFAGQAGAALSGTVIRGLSLGNFTFEAVRFGGNATTENLRVEGNYIGLRADGTTPRPNGTGVAINGGANHRVGGADPAARNVISGNLGNGVALFATGVVVEGNYIGTDAAGTDKRANEGAGVTVQGDRAVIGGTAPGAGNLISGNDRSGVLLGPANASTVIQGNLIGTDATGTRGLGNRQAGVGDFSQGAGRDNLIGGATAGARNVISGNGGTGVGFNGAAGSFVRGNYIGTTADGMGALPNGDYGVFLRSGPLTVGGSAPGEGNLISGNANGGVGLRGTGTVLEQNRIGVSAAGGPLGNLGPGVDLIAAANARVGGDPPQLGEAGNTIAYNQGAGVRVAGPSRSDRVSRNVMFANGGAGGAPGIDLVNGGNLDQQAPALAAARVSGVDVVVTGTVTGPAGAYRVEFFGTPADDEEGRAYLGSVLLTVPAGGALAFEHTLGAAAGIQPRVTATVTREATADTSEFSAPVTVGGTTPPANTPPAVGAIPAQTVRAGTATAAVPFTVADAETPAGDLTVAATSSNPGLVPAANVALGGAGGSRTVTVTPAAGQTGTATITIRVTDAGGLAAETTVTITVTAGPASAARPVLVGFPQFAVGRGAGAGPVRLFNPAGGERLSADAFPGFAGGVRAVAADFNGDGVADIVAGTGPGGPTRVRVLDGKTGAELFAVAPFEGAFTGGVFVAAGDLTGDGVPELVITPDRGGGPRVRVFDGRGFGQLADFFGIDDPNFRGGARASVGDVTGDGAGDLVVAAGFGGGPRVAAFDGTSLAGGAYTVKPFPDFFAFEEGLRNGAYVAAGDVDGDGFAELIAGGGPGGGPRVSAFSGAALLRGSQDRIADFFAGDPENRGGVRLAAKDLDGDARADVVAGAGDGAGSRITGYAGRAVVGQAAPDSLFAFDAVPGFSGGVFVG